jgi:hypothetical protein
MTDKLTWKNNGTWAVIGLGSAVIACCLVALA